MRGNQPLKLPILQDRSAIADQFDAVFGNDFSGRKSAPQDIPIELIDPSPVQARQEFTNLEELANAIRSQGFTSRVRVRPHPSEANRYQLVYGERRLRAAKMAGITLIPADVAQHTESELREIGLTENIIREDLNPMDEALGFEEALSARNEQGRPLYTMRSLAERLGKSTGYIDRRLALLKAPLDVQELVRKRPDTVQAAREIAKLDQPEIREHLIEGMLNGTMSSRAVEAAVKEALTPVQRSHQTHRKVEAVQERDDEVLSSGYDEEAAGSDEETMVRGQSSRPASTPVAIHGTEPTPPTPAGRDSARTRQQIEQRFMSLVPAVRDAIPALHRDDRDALIALIVDQIIPSLGVVVTELQHDQESSSLD